MLQNKALYTQAELLESLKSQLITHNISVKNDISEIVIDSSKATKNTLFICLKGENNDGHDFIAQAIENGCEAILVHKKELLEKYKNLILVKNTFDALYEIAKYSRSRSKAKIIAITGSMGKTTTKEITKTVFQSQGKTYATTGNLNNHFGLPLTICNMEKDVEFAILELGMNHLREIHKLSTLAKPDIAIITGITSAHIGNFKDEREIALAKSEIFDGISQNGTAIINRDNEHFEFLLKKAKLKTNNVISFGKNQNSDYILQNIEIQTPNSSQITIKKAEKTINYKISSSNDAIIQNSLMSLICLDLIGVDFEKGLKNFTKLEEQKGRGNVFDIKINDKNITIIDDSYNANLASVKAGIDYICSLKKTLAKKRSIVILGDILELGEKSQEIHDEIFSYIAQKSIDLTLTAGENTKKSTKTLYKNIKNFSNSKEISLEAENLIQDGDIILIKGSRGMKMEQIIDQLNKKASA